MKNTSLLFVSILSFAFTSPKSFAQNQNQEQQMDNSGYRVTGYTLFKPTFQSNNYDISLMKYIDYGYSDTTLGVLFKGYTILPGREPGFMRQFSAMVSYEEISSILSWLDDAHKKIIDNPNIENLSYEPIDNKLLFYIEKNVNSYTLYIQYDKYIWYTNQILCKIGYSSKKGYDFERFEVFYNQLNEVNDAIDKYTSL